MTFRQHVLETSLRYTIDREKALRLYYRYERAQYEDWHYDGLQNVLASEAVFLGAGPRDYSVSLVGLFFQYTAR
jgi:Putative outer membrane beta-barrel porin, MtrB/PioB